MYEKKPDTYTCIKKIEFMFQMLFDKVNDIYLVLKYKKNPKNRSE